MLKPFLLVSAVALVLIAPMGAPAQAKSSSAKASPELDKAKKIYAMDCALCHGDTGDGKTSIATDMQLTLSDWTDPKTLADKKDADLFKIIRNGKDKMPPEDTSRAKDDEVQALVQYIRTFAKNAPATPAPAAAPAAPPAAAPAASNATPAPGSR